MPGAWLLAIARLVFDDVVMADVVIPTVADLRAEWIAAGVNRRNRFLALARGYLAFWSLVLIAPAAFRRWPGRAATGRVVWLGSFVTAIVLLLMAWRANMHQVLGEILNRLPDGTLGVLGAGAGFAFLVGPIVLGLMILRRWRDGPDRFRIHAGEATLVSVASVVLATFLGTAGVFHTFESIGRTGSAGLEPVTTSIVGATRPVVIAVASSTVCLLAFAFATFRDRRRGSSGDHAASGSTRRAFGWSVLVVAVLIAVDQLLRLHHEMMNLVLLLLGPPHPGVSGRFLAGQSEEIIPPLLAGAALLTVVTLVAGFGLWRSSSIRPEHPLLTWTSRVALVAALVGGAWHGTIVKADLDAFRNNVAEVRSAASGR